MMMGAWSVGIVAGEVFGRVVHNDNTGERARRYSGSIPGRRRTDGRGIMPARGEGIRERTAYIFMAGVHSLITSRVSYASE